MISLHVHSNYSILQGTITLDNLINFALENNCKYAALTDTDGMYGLIQFAKKAKEVGIKPILGSLITDFNDENEYAIFYAKNNTGYSELCKIITKRKLQEDFSLTEIIKNCSENIFVITPSIKLLCNILPVEENQKKVCAELIVAKNWKNKTRKLYNFALENKIPIVASHPAYFYEKDDFTLHKTVSAIRLNKTFENLEKGELADEEFYLKTPNEFISTWKKLPDATENLKYIVENCNVELELGVTKFPVFKAPNNLDSISYLWELCNQGLAKKYKPVTDEAKQRLQTEMEVIIEMGFTDYFLIVWDIVNEARRRGMVTIGRGSAANSIVSYCLDFTQVDPIKYNFYFERFLNKGRTNPPDVDLDFSWKERDEIVRYVFEKYGYGNVAMISTTVTFRARSAFRETAKVFGISEREISRFSKFIPWTSAQNLPILAEKFPEAKNLNFDDEPWKTVINIASKLSGFPRHLSIHPSGIVVTDKQITNYLALEYAKNKGLGLIITQPDMYPIEDMGLVKIDLLSQRSLSVLRDTLDTINNSEDSDDI